MQKKKNDDSFITCQLNEINMPTSDDYQIYSDGACGNIIDTGITVTYIVSKSISSIDMTLGDNTRCSEEGIKSIVVTLNTTPTGDVKQVTLTNQTEVL